MARHRDPRIRLRLRDQAVDYALSHGVWDLSLRPLAKALKTNARMLIYHFGSRESLLREILAGLREREDARIRSWFASGRRPRSLPEFLRWYWKRMSGRAARPAALLVFELYALALRHPAEYPGVLEDPVAYWRELTKRSGAAGETEDVTATLLLAATRGLLLDMAATGDRRRVGLALEKLAEMIGLLARFSTGCQEGGSSLRRGR
jgi:AcrR family transcriptional regulator